jgi:hypothetical protein
MIVGFLIGIVSTAIYLYIVPALRRFLRIGDTTGTLALHGFPASSARSPRSSSSPSRTRSPRRLAPTRESPCPRRHRQLVNKLPGLNGNVTVAFGYTFDVAPHELYLSTGSAHLQTHGLIILISIVLPLVAGFFTGLFLRFVGWACKLTVAEQDMYQDKTTFQVPAIDYPGE